MPVRDPHRPAIGLVGCGRWGRLILRDLVSLECDVHVVASNDASMAAAIEGGARTVVASTAALPQVAGYVVAVPATVHTQVIDELLPTMKPVFVEKPLTADAASARRIALQAPDRVFVMDKWRYLAGVTVLRDLAAQGVLGEVNGLRTVRVGWGRPHVDVDCAWTLAPHDLSIALEILGEVPRAAWAVADNPSDVRHLIGAGHTSTGIWHHLEVSSRSVPDQRRIEVIGSAATAVLAGGWDDRVVVHSNVGGDLVSEEILAVGELPLLAELRCFVAHLAGGPPPRTSVADGATIVETIAELRCLAGAVA